MTNKIGDLRNVLSKEPCDPKLLQMQLQGGIATSVNQVSCLPSVPPLSLPLSLPPPSLSLSLSPYLLSFNIVFMYFISSLFFINFCFLQGPFAIAKCFLEGIPKSEQTYLHHKLKVCFKEFTTRSVYHSCSLRSRFSLFFSDAKKLSIGIMI